MSNVLFGREVSAATAQPVATQRSATETVTSTVRGIASLMFWAGILACFTPAIALGVVLAIIGGLVWLVAPANSARTQQMVDESAQGGGCLSGFAAALFVVIAMVLAGLLAAGAGLAVVGGGL